MACFLLVMTVWVFSVCLHEYGHAWVAERGGDYTVREKGYLSMNPLNYTHPFLSFVLPIVFMLSGGIGLPGGAVYLNKNLLRSRGWETGVSLAGPAMNVLLAAIITLVLRIVLIPHFPDHPATSAFAFLLQLQISAILFNLIPIPPLDGYQAIEPWLPLKLKEHIRPFWTYGNFIIFILFFQVEPLNRAFWETIWWVSDLLGVDAYLGNAAFHAFQFWRQ
jgi:Zn-dependent protease